MTPKQWYRAHLRWGTKKPGDHLRFEHRFDPEGAYTATDVLRLSSLTPAFAPP
jgi:hypothetical protein